jgi:hypothetical protein
MQVTFEVLRDDGARIVAVTEWPTWPAWNKVEDIVRGYINSAKMAHVRVPYEGATRDMFVADLSDLRLGGSVAPVLNATATALYRASLSGADGIAPDRLPAIFGTAVLFDKPVWP